MKSRAGSEEHIINRTRLYTETGGGAASSLHTNCKNPEKAAPTPQLENLGEEMVTRARNGEQSQRVFRSDTKSMILKGKKCINQTLPKSNVFALPKIC